MKDDAELPLEIRVASSTGKREASTFLIIKLAFSGEKNENESQL